MEKPGGNAGFFLLTGVVPAMAVPVAGRLFAVVAAVLARFRLALTIFAFAFHSLVLRGLFSPTNAAPNPYRRRVRER